MEMHMRFEARNEEKSPLHEDYKGNVNWGAKFVKNFNEFHDNAIMEIRMSEKLDNETYYFLFSHSENDRILFANPIDPNKENKTFLNEFKCTYFSFAHLRKKWEEKNKGYQNFKEFDSLMKR